MPIVSIIEQPTASQIVAAYRPIVFKVRAKRTDGNARPPVVYCDIYFNNIFYKTLSKTQYVTLNASDSDWYFDVQDACQEVLTKYLAPNGGSSILLTTGLIKTSFCRFRSSGFDSNGFIQAEGTKPVQGTGTASPVSGTGTQSSTFYIINAVLQHNQNQNLITHLNAYKQGTWAATTYPLTHRTNNYNLCKNSSDYFPILRTGAPNCVRIKYRFKNQSIYNTLTYCASAPVCTGVAISPTPALPDGGVGAPYNYSITLTGTAPFKLIDIVKPSWMTITLAGSTIKFTGMPNATGTSIGVSFTVLNCNDTQDVDFSDTINVTAACVNVTIPDVPNLGNAIIGEPYSEDIELDGTAPYVLNVTSKPSWMTIALSGSTVQLRGTPVAPAANNVTVSFNVTNCTTGSVTFSDTIDVIGARGNWTFDNEVGVGGSMRIIVNNATREFTTVSDSGFIDLNPGDQLEVVVMSTTTGHSIIDISGSIIDLTDDAHVASAGPYTVPAGNVQIDGIATNFS